MIRAVSEAVAAILPDVPLHLWGIKLGALTAPVALPDQVISVDSAAWNGFFGHDHERWKQSGMQKRVYSYRVALPDYLVRVERTLRQPKQRTLEWT